MNPNKVAFVAVVAILEHVAGTLAKPSPFLNGHGEHWVNGVGGGEVFFERDEFHFLNLCCCLLYISIIVYGRDTLGQFRKLF